MIEREPVSPWPLLPSIADFTVPIRIRWWPPDNRQPLTAKIIYYNTTYKNPNPFNPRHRHKPLAKLIRLLQHKRRTHQGDILRRYYSYKIMPRRSGATIRLPKGRKKHNSQTKNSNNVKETVPNSKVSFSFSPPDDMETFADARETLSDEEEDMENEEESFPSIDSMEDSMDDLLNGINTTSHGFFNKPSKSNQRVQGRDKRTRTGKTTSLPVPSEYTNPTSPMRDGKRSNSHVAKSPLRPSEKDNHSEYSGSDITPRKLVEEADLVEESFSDKINKKLDAAYEEGKFDDDSDDVSSKAYSRKQEKKAPSVDSSKSDEDNGSSNSSSNSSDILDVTPILRRKKSLNPNRNAAATLKQPKDTGLRKSPPETLKLAATLKNQAHRKPSTSKVAKSSPPLTPPRVRRDQMATVNAPARSTEKKPNEVEDSSMQDADVMGKNNSGGEISEERERALHNDEMVRERSFKSDGSSSSESSEKEPGSAMDASKSDESSISTKASHQKGGGSNNNDDKSISGNSAVDPNMTHYLGPRMLEHMPSKGPKEKLRFVQFSFDPAPKARNLKTSIVPRVQEGLNAVQRYDPSARLHFTGMSYWGTSKTVTNLTDENIGFHDLDYTLCDFQNVYMVSPNYGKKKGADGKHPQRRPLVATFVIGFSAPDPDDIIRRVNNCLENRSVSIWPKKHGSLRSQARIGIMGLHPDLDSRSIALAMASPLAIARQELSQNGKIKATDPEEPPSCVIQKRRYNQNGLVLDSNDLSLQKAASMINLISPDLSQVYQIEHSEQDAQDEVLVWNHCEITGSLHRVLGVSATIIGVNLWAVRKQDMQQRGQLTKAVAYSALISLEHTRTSINGLTDPYKQVKVTMKPFDPSSPPLQCAEVEYLPVSYDFESNKKSRNINWIKAEFHDITDGNLVILRPHRGGEKVQMSPERVRYTKPFSRTTMAELLTRMPMFEDGIMIRPKFATSVLPNFNDTLSCDLIIRKGRLHEDRLSKINNHSAGWFDGYLRENCNFGESTVSRLVACFDMQLTVNVDMCTYDSGTFTVTNPVISTFSQYEQRMDDYGFDFGNLEEDMAKANAVAEKDDQDLAVAEKLRKTMRLRDGGTGASYKGEASVLTNASTAATGSLRSVTSRILGMDFTKAKVDAAKSKAALATVQIESARKISEIEMEHKKQAEYIAQLEARLNKTKVGADSCKSLHGNKGSKEGSQVSGISSQENSSVQMTQTDEGNTSHSVSSQDKGQVFDELIMEAHSAVQYISDNLDETPLSESVSKSLHKVKHNLVPYKEIGLPKDATDEWESDDEVFQFLQKLSLLTLRGWGKSAQTSADDFPTLTSSDKDTASLVTSRICLAFAQKQVVNTPYLTSLMDILHARMGIISNEVTWPTVREQADKYPGTIDEALEWLRTATTTSSFPSDHG